MISQEAYTLRLESLDFNLLRKEGYAQLEVFTPNSEGALFPRHVFFIFYGEGLKESRVQEYPIQRGKRAFEGIINATGYFVHLNPSGLEGLANSGGIEVMFEDNLKKGIRIRLAEKG